jgi:peptidoglycan hydrolase-like protein with peptidoglycan-binding domain
MEEKRIALYQLMIGNETYTKDYASFETQFFTSEVQTKKLWAFLLQKLIYTKTLKEFYNKFCCDLVWAKSTSYCGGGSTTTTGSTTGNTTNTTGNTTNTTGNTTNTTGKTTTNVVNIKTDEVANGSKLVKRGMSGDIVREIQKLLIKHGFTNISKSGEIDGIYGSRTAQAVYDFQQKSEIATDRIVGKETWGKLIQEPTSAKVPVKLDPKTGLPDNSLGLPKFDTSVDRFNKFGISKEKQDADLKKLGLKENMKLTDIITGMVQEQRVIPGKGIDGGNGYYLPGFPSQTTPTQPSSQSKLTPNQRLAITKGFGPVSAEYADKLVKDGKLAGGTPPAGKLPSGVPSMPSLKDVLNPTKSNLGPVSNKPAAGATAGAKSAGTVGKPNNYTFPSIKDILNPPQSNLGPVGGKKPSGTAAPVAGTAAGTASGTAAPVAGTAAPAVKPQQPYSLTDVAKGGYLRSGMKGVVVRDMQELIKNNFPEIEIDLNGVFNQQTLDAVIKVQKMLGVKPKNGKYGIFGPITIGAINKSKTGANDKFKIDPKTGLPFDTVGAMRDKLPDADTTTNSNTPLPKFNTDASRFSKYGVSKAQQDADLKKLGLQEDLVKKIVSKHLHSKL